MSLNRQHAHGQPTFGRYSRNQRLQCQELIQAPEEYLMEAAHGMKIIPFSGTIEVEHKPGWYALLEQAIDDEVAYDADEGYPVANGVAKDKAAKKVREIYDAFGSDTPEPYFDVAPDSGVDIYFDHGADELQIHIPPLESENHYCFIRVGGQRTVHRHPPLMMLTQLLRQVVDVHVVPAE